MAKKKKETIAEAETESGRPMSIKNFFEDCPERQEEYEKAFVDMVNALEEQWGDSYKPALHDSMVDELVRSELMSFHYEKLLANNTETDATQSLLTAERITKSTLREKLLISLEKVRKEEPPTEATSQPSIFSLKEQAYQEELP